MRKLCILIIVLACSVQLAVQAQVKYDEGRREVLGVQLLEDANNENTYYYLPQYPRLSVKTDGSVELLCIKYIGEGDQPSGGLFHALIEFSLPDSILNLVKTKLEDQVPGAQIAGPVPLLPFASEDGDGTAGFQLVSAILSNTGGEDSFSRSVITSGHAPLLPGSKSAIAANLTPEGATLLWNSFTGPTSDVSASINACYEAQVKAYNAVVTAEMSVVYEHFSQMYNYQHDYTKRELRDVADELHRDGKINVEVFDRSKGLDISVSDMDKILNLVTDKLVEVLFNTETGWSKAPEKEEAVVAGQIKGRQKQGWITKLFKGTGNSKYISDNQFVLKKRSDIQSNTFYLNLSKTTTVKVPVHSSGNLGGFYESMGQDDNYFRIVDLNDAAFQAREVFFQIDGEYVDAFKSRINFVSVNFKKEHGGHPATTKEVFFNYSDVEKGVQIKSISYPRLGENSADWLNYDYQLNWSIRGIDEPVSIPLKKEEWMTGNAPVISLKPPFRKTLVEIDAERSLFQPAGVSTAIVEFASSLAGKKEKVGRVLLRADDAEALSRIYLYHDADEDVVYRITWVSKSGTQKMPLQLLDTDYLFLIPPETQN
jgi:hypothetical protein